MKILQSKYKTGDKVLRNGLECTVGLFIPRINKIEIKVKINKTSVITDFISTRELNKLQPPINF